MTLKLCTTVKEQCWLTDVLQGSSICKATWFRTHHFFPSQSLRHTNQWLLKEQKITVFPFRPACHATLQQKNEYIIFFNLPFDILSAQISE